MLKALIPVRSGSQRVKNKNIRDFAGSNLLQLKINQLKQIEGIDEICINSDSEEMLEIALNSGVTAILRDPAYATNDVSMNDVYENLALNMDCDHVLYTNVTSPLVKNETYEKCIKIYKNLENYDSLNTVTLLKENLWLNGKPINYDPDFHPRSQDLPDVVYLNFAINIISRKTMIERRNIVGKKFSPYCLDEIESIDIDTPLDFKIAEIIYRERNENGKKIKNCGIY